MAKAYWIAHVSVDDDTAYAASIDEHGVKLKLPVAAGEA